MDDLPVDAPKLDHLLDAFPDGVSFLKPIYDGSSGAIIDFEFVYANKASWVYTNLPYPFRPGIRIIESNIPDELAKESTFRQYLEVFETGKSMEFTYYHNSSQRYIDARRQKYENGILSIVRERNPQQQSASFLQSVIDKAQTAICLLQPVHDLSGSLTDFRFHVANDVLAGYVQQEQEALTGTLASKWFPSYNDNKLFEKYRHTYLTGAAQRFEFHYDADNIDAWLDIRITKIYDDVLVTFSDHTPLRQLQQQLEQSVEELSRSNGNLEQFAYVASHDLQEPLRKIQSFGDILNNRFKEQLGNEGADMVNRMQTAARRMQTLIEDLLLFSRVSARSKTLEEVDLNLVLKEVITDLETSVKEKNAVIEVERLAPIHGDALQLRQLFQNILSNALKFNKPGVPPVITVKSTVISGSETGIKLSPKELKKKFQHIEISDNGIGFEQQYAERIFQIFQRLHGRSEYPGTGVGLSIVQKVVDNHEGKIVANGTVGEGAIFKVLLPV